MVQVPVDEYIALANKRIAERTHYGMRQVSPSVTSMAYYWSNGSARWVPSYRMNAFEPQMLDANYIYLPYIDKNVAWETSELFDPLPLFRNSFEAVFQNKKPANGMAMPGPEGLDLAPNQILTLEDFDN